ncbi:taste receptor type 2 member 40-like [Microcaecilia unicolor]|uniref:Taste receptor type 2 n=1 Tax=Microcaecilia unicolor TaxID=1415580 RepID=A0A6P7WXR6_9AMPH|nr:taste receptor type 2 member 40-like [Microcaecilia unicolor]
MDEIKTPDNLAASLSTINKTLLTASFILELTFPFVEALFGIIVNLFIVAVNVAGWARSHRLNSCDLIITCLNSEQVLMQVLNLVPFILFCCPACEKWTNQRAHVLTFLELFLSHTSFWFVACLHVFYCVRIANFRQLPFQWLKARTHCWVPRMLLGSLFTSFIIAFPAQWTFYTFHPIFTHPVLLQNVTGNETFLSLESMTGGQKVVQYAAPLTLLFFSYMLPFLMCCGAAAFLLISLCRHTRQMTLNSSSFRGPSQEAHFKAIRSVAMFCVVFILYFLAIILYRLDALLPLCNRILLCPLILMGFPTIHALILIFTNTKLRQAAARILLCGMCKGGRGA